MKKDAAIPSSARSGDIPVADARFAGGKRTWNGGGSGVRMRGGLGASRGVLGGDRNVAAPWARLFDVALPEREQNGIILAPGTATLRIQE